MAMRAPSYSPAQYEKALALVAHADRWSYGYRKSDGLQFVVFASASEPGQVCQTHINGLGCTCQAGKRNVPCYHTLAASLATEKARAAATKRPVARYEDLYDLEDAF